jgi:hypothetical protein
MNKDVIHTPVANWMFINFHFYHHSTSYITLMGIPTPAPAPGFLPEAAETGGQYNGMLQSDQEKNFPGKSRGSVVIESLRRRPLGGFP